MSAVPNATQCYHIEALPYALPDVKELRVCSALNHTTMEDTTMSC